MPEKTFRPWPKHLATSRRSRKILVGRETVTIPPAIRPVVDAWEAGYEARFRVRPEPPKTWDLEAALGLVERHGLPLVLEIVEGAMRVGTKFMRDREKWGLRSIADEWNVLVAMKAKGDLR